MSEVVSVVVQCSACGHLMAMHFPETSMNVYPSLCLGDHLLGNSHAPTVQVVVGIRWL
jgi:hypothetical protein